MEAETTDKERNKWEGIPCSEEELRETEKCWNDIKESIELVNKKGKNI